MAEETLFGKGGIQGLDGEAHRHRKAMFMSLMSPEGVGRLGAVTADWFRAYARKWAGREQVVFYDEVNEILARAACDWAGVPLAESDVGRRTAELMAMFDRAATLSPAHLWSRLARWRAERWIGDLIGQADLRPGVSSLDVGCGTGTLALAVAAACPGLTTVGLDADPDVLGLAVGKAARTGSVVRFDQGLATALPYPDESFDHVFSSLMLHHLTGEERRAALREVVRVLKPGGRFHLVDWCRPHTPFMWIAFLAVRTLDGFGRTADSARGRLPALLREAGLGEPERLGRYATVGGTLCRYRAKKS